MLIVAPVTCAACLAVPGIAPAVWPSIACPQGPAGWRIPSGVSVQIPTNNDQVRVSCHYATRGKTVDVVVDYAVPWTPQPYTTSTCTTSTGTPPKTPAAWNARDRLFRVVSPRAWTYAGFVDTAQVLTPKDVPALERVARALLQRSVSLAESCKATAAPVPGPQSHTYALSQSSTSGGVTTRLSGSGTFTTAPTASDPVGPVSSLSAGDLTLTFQQPGTSPHTVTLQVQKALGYTGSPRVLTVAVAVTAVNAPDSGCSVGDTGTAAIRTEDVACGCGSATANFATLTVCGRTFLQ